jgi:hypothetical protein
MLLSRAYLAKKLSRPLPIKDGRVLRTIADARAYMLALPDHREQRQTWQHAAKLIVEEANRRRCQPAGRPSPDPKHKSHQ